MVVPILLLILVGSSVVIAKRRTSLGRWFVHPSDAKRRGQVSEVQPCTSDPSLESELADILAAQSGIARPLLKSERFRQSSYEVQRKDRGMLTVSDTRIFVRGPDGSLALFASGRRLGHNDDILLYGDEAQAEGALLLRALGSGSYSHAAYEVEEPQSDETIGTLKRPDKWWSDPDHWVLLDSSGHELGRIKPDSPIAHRALRGVGCVLGIPLSLTMGALIDIGESRYRCEMGGQTACTYSREKGNRLSINLSEGGASLDWRMAIAVGVLLALFPSRTQ